MENKNSGKFANFMSKASDFGKKASDFTKKAANEVQKGAKEFGEQTQKALHEQKIKYYNPLFKEKFFSDDFALPNIIKIVDEAERRDVDVCDGAIGWTRKYEGVEVLFLYDEFINESKINFIPFAKCDTIYCLDVFEKGRYINSDTIFDSALKEKIAELENIVYCLGAKNYSIEMTYDDTIASEKGININLKTEKATIGLNNNNANKKITHQSGKNVTHLSGNNTLQEPKLKWFKHDENIKNLIKMRLSGDNTLKAKTLIFNGSSFETISKKHAATVDLLQKKGAHGDMIAKSLKEQSSSMILEVEF